MVRRTSLGLISCGLLAVLAFGATPARAEAVDLELVFAADGSGSIDDDAKSITLTTMRSSSHSARMFDGLRSRWMMPFWCA